MSTIAAVSYLNAKPLIHDLEQAVGVRLVMDVPSRLLATLETGAADIALCPVIDYHRAQTPLEIVPVGGIGSHRATLTVRLFSRRPFAELTRVEVDGDSHTSVALLQVLHFQRWHRRLELKPLASVTDAADPWSASEAVLLIGDKVVTQQPHQARFPHQLDLGEAWWRLTGLPFVFAVWMAPLGAELGTLPAQLAATRRRNMARLDEVVECHASACGWPLALAREYLGSRLCYEIGDVQLASIELFWERCHELGIVTTDVPLRLAGQA